MPQLIKPVTKVTVIPRDGELEITLNINITVDGQISASSEQANVSIQSIEKKETEDKIQPFIPNFTSGMKLNFGKEK